MNKPHVSSGGRYPVLRALAILQLVAAVLVAIGGIIASIYGATYGGNVTSAGDKIIIALGGLAATFFLVIFTLAFAELLKLLIDIEHNTRMMSAGMPANGQAATSPSAGSVNRIKAMEEESAEAALVRGH